MWDLSRTTRRALARLRVRGGRRQVPRPAVFCLCLVAAVWGSLAAADPEVGANQSTPSGAEDAGGDPQLGYRWLTERAYLPADFHQETFEQIWKVWPAELRERARAATPEQRREMAYARYGLTPRPGDPQQRPLQYVVGEDGSWTMNCFACHGGTVYGETYPGAPNNRYALQTLTEEMRKAKFATGGKMTRMDLGSLLMPLGSTVGRTNAVMFGVGLMHYRRPDLSIDQDAGPPQFTHHDMDAPPWWHFHRKEKLYIDGFASKGHRGLMQFTLVRENGPEKFRQWEEEFRDIYAYLMTLRPPQYPGRIDRELAAEGRRLFNDTCARCHGTYDAGGSYPGVTVPIEELGTDPVRLSALPVEGRKKYAASWFAHAGEPEAQETVVDPAGYVAPPLDGVWASAPYFHNGSVPTLWHVLHPGERPRLWRRSGIEMDSERVGLQVRTADRIPLSQTDPAERREWFDTAGFGKSAAGHEYPLELSVVERRAVLEYLKTL